MAQFQRMHNEWIVSEILIIIITRNKLKRPEEKRQQMDANDDEQWAHSTPECANTLLCIAYVFIFIYMSRAIYFDAKAAPRLERFAIWKDEFQ